MPVKPPAVCILIENLTVPFDRRVWQEARALRDAGYRVSVICPKGSGFTKSYEVLEGIEVYRHPIWEASGVLGYFIEYGWALTAEFFLALRVYARTRFKILQACNPPDTMFLIGRFFKLFGVRFIFDHHDLNPELFDVKFKRRGLAYKLVCWAEKMTFRTAKISIATNESYREIALGRGGMKRENTFIVRSLPDLSFVRTRRPRPDLMEGRRYLVVYLGVMGPQDGIDLWLHSIAAIEKKRDDTLFVLIGTGTEFPALKALAAKLGIEHCTRFTGRIPDAEVAAYFSTATVGVAPDPATPMNDKSTMNKILEYMAYGIPVVLYDLTEGRRSAGDAALYAKDRDINDFADKVLTLLDSESLSQKMGASGRKRVEDNLNWAHEKQALLDAYAAALRD
jgi:glycosyltransferase involved in cell wall biosynthesis